jgi:D-xylonolactonase
MTQTEDHARLVWPLQATLGEGPIWVPEEGALWFVDIKGGRLHRFVPEGGESTSFDIGGQPSFAVLAPGGGLIVGNGNALQRVEDGAVVATIATIDMPAHNRTNDATVDAAGRLWFGTMDDDETAATGRVYRFDGMVHEVGGACTITNGPAVSPDGRHLYHVDTLAGQIWLFDLSGDTDALVAGTPFVTIDPADGHPDGVTVDAEGCVWVGLWGGWCARRYDAAGVLLTTIRLPCANVTKVAFGGEDLRTGYVTTARKGLTEAELAAQPLAGGLFAFDAPAPGQPAFPVVIG